MLQQFQFIDLLSQNQPTRNQATNAHNHNMNHPAMYLAQLTLYMQSCLNECEVQMILQLTSQIIKAGKLSVENLKQLLQHSAERYILKNVSVKFKKMFKNNIKCMIEQIHKKQSICEVHELREMGIFAKKMLGLVISLKVKEQIKNAISILNILFEYMDEEHIYMREIGEHTISEESPYFKLGLEEEEAVKELVTMVLFILKLNRTYNFKLFHKCFKVAPKASIEYIMDLYSQNEILHSQICQLLDFFFAEVINKAVTHFEEDSQFTLCELLNSLFGKYFQFTYYRDCQEIIQKSSYLFELKMEHVNALQNWVLALLQKQNDTSESSFLLTQVLEPFYNSHFSSPHLLEAPLHNLADLILQTSQNLSNLPYYAYYLISVYYRQIRDYFNTDAIVEKCIKDIEGARFGVHHTKINMLHLIRAYFKHLHNNNCKVVSGRVLKSIYQMFAHMKENELKICIKIFLTPKIIIKSVRETKAEFIDLEEFSQNIWSVIASATDNAKTDILCKISEIIEEERKADVGFLIDLLYMINQNQMVFEDNYKCTALSVRCSYLRLISVSLEFCQHPIQVFKEVLMLLKMFDFHSIKEDLEIQSTLQVMTILLKLINTQNPSILTGLPEILMKILNANLKDFLSHKKLMAEMLSLDADYKNEYKSKQDEAIIKMHQLLICKIIECTKATASSCDILELAIKIYPQTVASFTSIILNKTKDTFQYYRLAYFLNPDPYPEIKNLLQPNSLTEMKWITLFILGQFERKSYGQLCREKPERREESKIIEYFKKMNLGDEIDRLKPTLSQLYAKMQSCQDEDKSWQSDLEETSIQPLLIKQFREKYRRKHIMLLIKKYLEN